MWQSLWCVCVCVCVCVVCVHVWVRVYMRACVHVCVKEGWLDILGHFSKKHVTLHTNGLPTNIYDTWTMLKMIQDVNKSQSETEWDPEHLCRISKQWS